MAFFNNFVNLFWTILVLGDEPNNKTIIWLPKLLIIIVQLLIGRVGSLTIIHLK